MSRTARARLAAPASSEARGRLAALARSWFVVVSLLSAASGCRREASGDSVLVFAAASTADALEEHARAFEASSGCHVSFSFASSQDLARQIELGAPADLFVSADSALVAALVRAGQVAASDAVPWMSNQLVIVVPRASAADVQPNDLPRVAQLALGDPERVPAGRYAQRWLEREGLWGQVQARVVPALDVRAALAMVEAGRAEAGIVYRSDAAHSQRVRVSFSVPSDRSGAISYAAARLRRSDGRCGRELLQAWRTPAARDTFARHGFLP